MMTNDLNEKKVLITTVPFGNYERSPLELLDRCNVDYTINPLGRKPTEEETINMIGDYGIVLAGTSPFTKKVIDNAPHLRLIARAGVGLDNVDLQAARDKGIQVTYTPQAPVPAVAEFTVGLMLTSLRHIHQANQSIHLGEWKRKIGRRLGESTVGLLGIGPIGKKVIEYLSGFSPKILACDIDPDLSFCKKHQVQCVGREELLQKADIISVHLPLTGETEHLIGRSAFETMKPDAVLINTARGGIVDEEALFEALTNKTISAAALDVFENEPYEGPLAQLDNCLMTCHMASASVDCKRAMETGAVEEIIKFLNGEPLDMVVQ